MMWKSVLGMVSAFNLSAAYGLGRKCILVKLTVYNAVLTIEQCGSRIKMQLLLTSLLLLVPSAVLVMPVAATLPLVDRARGIIEQRPYCPARPASPEFQRAALNEFVNEFFEEGLVQQALDSFVSEDYIQHNPFILSGRQNTIKALSLGGSYDFSSANLTILQVLFDSPYGAVHYKVQLPGQAPTAITDLWRFNRTCIEEHWDVIEALPANATNPIALF